jgi:hypothetical protein
MPDRAIWEVPVGRREDDVSPFLDQDLKVALPERPSAVEARGWEDLDVDVRPLLQLPDEILDGALRRVRYEGCMSEKRWTYAVRGWLNRNSSESVPKPLK